MNKPLHFWMIYATYVENVTERKLEARNDIKNLDKF